MQLREIYATAVTSDIVETPEYKESLQLLGFLSKEELVAKVDNILEIVRHSSATGLKEVEVNLANDALVLRNASLEIAKTSGKTVSVEEKLSRAQLKEVRSINIFLYTNKSKVRKGSKIDPHYS